MEIKKARELVEFINQAKELGLTEKEIQKKFKKYPREVKDFVKGMLLEKRIETNKTKLKKLKGGFNKNKMPKKTETEQYDDDFDLTDEDDEDEEFEDEVIEKPKPKLKRAKPKVNPNYFFDHSPEKIRLLDPIKKTVIFEGGNEMSVLLQMNARILQLLEEKL